MKAMNRKIHCDDITGLIDAYADGELSAKDRASIEGHAAGCAACARAIAATRAVSGSLRAAGRYAVPAGIGDRIRAALSAEAARAPDPVRRWWRPVTSHLAAAMAGAAIVALLVGGAGLSPRGPANQEAVSAHVRGLLGRYALSVESGNQHIVRPWFAGKIEFAPRVADLAGDGFPLRGGRVDILGGRAAAALMYGRREHRITVLIQPLAAAAASANSAPGERGYHVEIWRDAEFVYWAISDLNRAELKSFVALLQRANKVAVTGTD